MLVILYVVITVISLYVLYTLFSPSTPKLHGNPESDLYIKTIKHFTFLEEKYRPPWWAQNGIVMTVVRSFQTEPSLPYTREIFEFPDGGITALDWLHPDGAPDDIPLLLLLPGVVGHTYDGSYLYNPAKEAFSRGWRVLIVNRRGLGTPLRTPKLFCSDNTEDFCHVVDLVAKRYPKAKKIGCGFSLGGMILFNYLATRTKENAVIDAGISISAPFSNGDAAKRMTHLLPRLLVTPPMMKSLINSILQHEEILTNHISYPNLKKAKSLRDFDAVLTAPLAGFDDEDHYYRTTQLHSKIHNIPIPFLVLTAENDFLVHLEDVPIEKIRETENIICLVTKHGEHTAFMETSHINGRGFAERVLFEWAHMHLDEK